MRFPEYLLLTAELAEEYVRIASIKYGASTIQWDDFKPQNLGFLLERWRTWLPQHPIPDRFKALL